MVSEERVKDELIGWCSSCDRIWTQSEFETNSDDEYALCPECGDYLITKQDEDAGKLLACVERLKSQLLTYRESGALEALRKVASAFRVYDESRGPLGEQVKEAIAKLEAIGE